MKKIMCCKKCDKRYPGYHDDCEAFQAEKGARDREKSAIQEEKNLGYMNRECILKSIERRRRK